LKLVEEGLNLLIGTSTLRNLNLDSLSLGFNFRGNVDAPLTPFLIGIFSLSLLLLLSLTPRGRRAR
jgi:hypothetical protein